MHVFIIMSLASTTDSYFTFQVICATETDLNKSNNAPTFSANVLVAIPTKNCTRHNKSINVVTCLLDFQQEQHGHLESVSSCT